MQFFFFFSCLFKAVAATQSLFMLQIIEKDTGGLKTKQRRVRNKMPWTQQALAASESEQCCSMGKTKGSPSGTYHSGKYQRHHVLLSRHEAAAH